MAGIKFLIILSSMGIVAPYLQPWLAQSTTMPPLSGWGQFGTSGIFAGLLFWVVTKTIPQITKDSKEGLNNMASEVKGLREDWRKGQADHLGVLRECLKNRE